MCLDHDAERNNELAAACQWSANQLSLRERTNIHVISFTPDDIVQNTPHGLYEEEKTSKRNQDMDMCQRTEEHILDITSNATDLMAVIGIIPNFCNEVWAPKLTQLGIPQLVYSSVARLPVHAAEMFERRMVRKETHFRKYNNGEWQNSLFHKLGKETKDYRPPLVPEILSMQARSINASHADENCCIPPLVLLDGGFQAQATELFAVLKFYGWSRFAILARDTHEQHAYALMEFAKFSFFNVRGVTIFSSASLTNNTLMHSILLKHRKLDASISVIMSKSFVEAEIVLLVSEFCIPDLF